MAYQSNPYLEEWANALRQQQRAAITQSYQDALPGFLSPLFGQDMYLGSNYKDHLAKYAAKQAADMANAEQGIISQKAMLEFELWQQQQEQARQMEEERRRREMEGFYADQAKIEGAMGASDSVWDRAKPREDAYFAPGYWLNGQWVKGTRPDDYSAAFSNPRKSQKSSANQSDLSSLGWPKFWWEKPLGMPSSPYAGPMFTPPQVTYKSSQPPKYQLTNTNHPLFTYPQPPPSANVRYGGGF